MYHKGKTDYYFQPVLKDNKNNETKYSSSLKQYLKV